MQESSIVVQRGQTEADPARLNVDAGQLDKLERLFAGLVEKERLQAAAWLVARDGEIVAHRSLGRRTFREDGDVFQPDTIRPVYSITKVITAVAILMLVEEGKLYIRQPVADWLEPFDHPMYRPISLWHLLTHTSGLAPDTGFDMEPYPKPWYAWWAHHQREKDKSRNWTADDTIRLILSGPPRDKPDRQWLYSTTGFALLAEVITRAAGMPYKQFVEERIFKPLGMNRSFFHVPEPLHEETCILNDWEEEQLGLTAADVDGLLTAGGNCMYSTLEDLWKFGQAMLNDGRFGQTQILGRRMIREMVTNQLRGVSSNAWGTKIPKFDYGLGWSINVEDLCTPGTFGHEGAGRCGLYIDPVEKLVFVYFVPTNIDWVPESVINPRNLVWSSLL